MDRTSVRLQEALCDREPGRRNRSLAAERRNHHPGWSSLYNRVDIVFSTHDCGCLSELDATLAGKIDGVAGG